jgi:hypothetical protein
MKDFLMSNENLPSPFFGGTASILTACVNFFAMSVDFSNINMIVTIISTLLGLFIAVMAIINGTLDREKKKLEIENEKIELILKQKELQELEKQKNE